jgi:hypothetical protein
MNIRDAKALQTASLETPTELGSNVVRDVSVACRLFFPANTSRHPVGISVGIGSNRR